MLNIDTYLEISINFRQYHTFLVEIDEIQKFNR
jgi:hypothetical protein